MSLFIRGFSQGKGSLPHDAELRRLYRLYADKSNPISMSSLQKKCAKVLKVPLKDLKFIRELEGLKDKELDASEFTNKVLNNVQKD